MGLKWYTLFSLSGYCELNHADIDSSKAFFTRLYIKCTLIAFIERLETCSIES